MAKKRLDVLVTERGLAESRQKAQAMIMAGQIFSGDRRLEKAGMPVDEAIALEVRGQALRYVGRGGLKLEKAMEVFPITLTDKICLDIGASTGGFTDCMLQNGAAKVYSIDVGYGQFAWKLRNDPRVVCLEKTNVRYVTQEQVPDAADFASIDVSFISLTKVLPAVLGVMKEDGQLVCLIKPQFEAGREKVGKNGVVKDIAVHKEVILMIADYAMANGLGVMGLDFSPIKGPKGNIEYLIYLDKKQPGATKEEVHTWVEEIAAKSHEVL